jgi:ammonium transporter, Amt family
VVNATLYVVFIFPFVVHWAWGNGWASPFRSRISEEVSLLLSLLSSPYSQLLGGCGVLDYSGSGVLHLTGGITAFIVSKLIGPRKGRFSSPGLHFHEYSTLFQSVGAVAMWIGWYGIILGSSNSNGATSQTISRSMAATTIAACSGCITSVLLGYVLNGFISPSLSNGGVLSGLVAISATCATCTMYAALIIGSTFCCRTPSPC